MSRRLFQVFSVSLVLVGCGKSEDEKVIESPLPTEALSLQNFEPAGFSLVNRDSPCNQMIGFFQKYAEIKLRDTLSSGSVCSKVTDSVFTADELKELNREPLVCEEDRQCYKVKFTVSKDNREDHYYALMVFFDDGQRDAVIAGARSNKHFLPGKEHTVFRGDLLSDGLSQLSETFNEWSRQ